MVDKLVKESILKTYKIKFEKEMGVKVDCVSLYHNGKKDSVIKVTISHSTTQKTSKDLDEKSSKTLQNLFLNKLAKVVRKSEPVKEIIDTVVDIDFKKSEVMIFARYMSTEEKIDLFTYKI